MVCNILESRKKRVVVGGGTSSHKRIIIKDRSAKIIKKSTLLPDLGAIFDKHVKHEFVDHDVEATMKTMVKEPYVHNVATLSGGRRYRGVYDFYKNHFVGKMPPDTKLTRISRTVGKNQVVDELILSFTHDREIDFMLPGIQPTGRFVELPHVVIMKFKGKKIAHEHIYWDQGSLLAQVGLLDPNRVPVVAAEQSRELQALSKGFKP
jgi:carboxymethylenebutenolidase